MSKEIMAYIGGLVAIGIGAAFLWFPPAQLAGQTATIGMGVGFIVTGLGAWGVAATVPPVVAGARRTALAEMRAAMPPARTGGTIPPPPR